MSPASIPARRTSQTRSPTGVGRDHSWMGRLPDQFMTRRSMNTARSRCRIRTARPRRETNRREAGTSATAPTSSAIRTPATQLGIRLVSQFHAIRASTAAGISARSRTARPSSRAGRERWGRVKTSNGSERLNLPLSCGTTVRRLMLPSGWVGRRPAGARGRVGRGDRRSASGAAAAGGTGRRRRPRSGRPGRDGCAGRCVRSASCRNLPGARGAMQGLALAGG